MNSPLKRNEDKPSTRGTSDTNEGNSTERLGLSQEKWRPGPLRPVHGVGKGKYGCERPSYNTTEHNFQDPIPYTLCRRFLSSDKNALINGPLINKFPLPTSHSDSPILTPSTLNSDQNSLPILIVHIPSLVPTPTWTIQHSVIPLIGFTLPLLHKPSPPPFSYLSVPT